MVQVDTNAGVAEEDRAPVRSAVAADPATVLGRIERAFAIADPAVLRLGAAGTSVVFSITGRRPERFTLLLDREPPQISEDSNAEVVIEMDSARAEEFSHGRLVLSNCLVAGEASYSGPVRKYLAVDPILRGLLARVEGGEA